LRQYRANTSQDTAGTACLAAAAVATAACLAAAAAAAAVQAGNDFLPNVPSIDIYDKPCGLDLLFSAYKALLPQMGGHITGETYLFSGFRL
jgi:hypothetical protein